MKRSCVVGLLILVLASFSQVCTVQAAYPEKPVRVIVPFDAGGGSDAFVRSLQIAIERNKLLGQPLAVFNVPGGGSAVGSRRVKDAAPDGYEILFNHAALLATEAMGRIDFSYRDFEAIAVTGSIYQAIMVREDSPFKTLKELMGAVKEKPNEVIYAVNMGGINHVAGIVLEKSAPGAKFRFAQVGAGAKCFAAIKGGHAQVGAFSGPEIVLYGQQGLRALATIAKQRDPNYPNMPSASELGYDAVFETVQMWFAPKGTHADRLNFLADTLEKAMRTDEFRKKIEEFKMGATFMRGKALRDYLESEYAKLVKILPKDK